MSAFNHMNSSLRLCIDSVDDHVLQGRVFSQRFLQPLKFSDLGNLVLYLEDVFDEQDFPQAFQRSRTFAPYNSDMSIVAPDPSSGMTPAVVGAARGAVATFDVLVISRRSSSWQGSVDWLDGSARQEFVSYLELLRMINERLFLKKT